MHFLWLNAYGVRVNTVWPTKFPSIDSIYEYGHLAKVNSKFRNCTIDLDKISAIGKKPDYFKAGYKLYGRLINAFQGIKIYYSGLHKAGSTHYPFSFQSKIR